MTTNLAIQTIVGLARDSEQAGGRGKLPNGATLLLGRFGETILAKRWGCQPYVTWITDRQGNAEWGHYFASLEAACQDYAQR